MFRFIHVKKKLIFPTGNSMRVSRLQVWRANHYTTEDIEQKKFKDTLDPTPVKVNFLDWGFMDSKF